MIDYIKEKFYSNSHTELKKEMSRVNKDFNSLLETLNNFNNKDVDLPINKEELENFPFLQWVLLNDKVKMRRRNNLFHYYLNFDCEMKESGGLGKHFHKDLIESVEVIQGSIIDKHTNKKYKQYDVIHYNKEELHEPVALEKSLLKVLFKP